MKERFQKMKAWVIGHPKETATVVYASVIMGAGIVFWISDLLTRETDPEKRKTLLGLQKEAETAQLNSAAAIDIGSQVERTVPGAHSKTHELAKNVRGSPIGEALEELGQIVAHEHAK